MSGRAVHVRSTKFDGSPHWEFESWFVREEGPLVVTFDFFGTVFQTWKGPWEGTHHTHNYFWTDRWYNVMRLVLPDGTFDGWYCNATTPAEFDGENVRYIDLDLDVLVPARGEPRVVDEDEFLEHSERMGYPRDVIEHARDAVDELLRLAAAGEPPFEERAAL